MKNFVMLRYKKSLNRKISPKKKKRTKFEFKYKNGFKFCLINYNNINTFK